MSKKAKIGSADHQSVLDVINTIVPGKTIEHWFSWPPDVFLMTSYILKKTGAYRHVVNDPEWNFEEIEGLQAIGRQWLASIQIGITSASGASPRLPKEIKAMIDELQKSSPAVTFTDLRSLGTKDSQDLSFLLLKIHALADTSCGSFGILGAQKKEVAIVHFLANLLLVTRGSLSTVPKYQGIVIPKMRTPQTGLTIRSFSLHLTYHDTEVEIMWRVVPWMNVDQNIINILCVPWPTEVESAEFNCKGETFENVRYFGYDKAANMHAKIHELIEQLIRLNKERGRIHMMVLPEVALSEHEYDYLLALLKEVYEQRRLSVMPMVLSGVRKLNDPASSILDLNYVKLAAFFVGKWYDLSQTKHHRWKLDRGQLMQYELSSRFSTERSWFEKIEIRQRRLSFLVPNSWLALCPLICEDLAQLEPVSEIIRGVGPTMLVALLMDGPQIKERWPARYASVFADDPGTAVLTLTSIGMIRKSSQLQDPSKLNLGGIGLWKDQITGWKNIDVKDTDSTALLTVSASFKKEICADGRSDGGQASTFKLDNVFYPKIPTAQQQTMKEPRQDTIGQSSIWRGEWRDLQELTCLTYAIDTLLSSFGDHWSLIKSWIIDESYSELSPVPHYAYITNLLLGAYQQPHSVGISTSLENWPTKSLKWAVSAMEKWKELFGTAGTIFQNDTSRIEDYYNNIVNEVEAELKLMQEKEAGLHSMDSDRQDQHRIEKAIPLAILVLMHNRLDEHRRDDSRKGIFKLAECFKRIERIVAQYDRFSADL